MLVRAQRGGVVKDDGSSEDQKCCMARMAGATGNHSQDGLSLSSAGAGEQIVGISVSWNEIFVHGLELGFGLKKGIREAK